MTALELDEVTKTHAGAAPVVALRSVSLRIGQGEFVAVVGPSGSGKTTLLSIAGTLERPTSGTVRVAGNAVQDLPDGALSAVRSQHIGFVFQQFFLIPTFSTLDNVANGLLYRGTPAPERRRAAAEAIEAVGLGPRAQHRPGELSGGECQRVAIARALVGRPAIILADEPTGSLDTATGRDILELLAHLHAGGTTIVVVTHNDEIAAAVPRVVRLRDGEIEHDTQRRHCGRGPVTDVPRSRLHVGDVWALAVLGLRGRPARAVLSAAGVALGVATMVAVLGISSSSRAQLVAQIDALGTNLLTVAPAQSFSGETVTLPKTAPAMVGRIGPVLGAAAIGDVYGQGVPEQLHLGGQYRGHHRLRRRHRSVGHAARANGAGPIPERGHGAVPGRRPGSFGGECARCRPGRRLGPGVVGESLVQRGGSPGSVAPGARAGPECIGRIPDRRAVAASRWLSGADVRAHRPDQCATPSKASWLPPPILPRRRMRPSPIRQTP